VTQAVSAHDVFRIYATQGGSTAALQGLTLTVEPGELLLAVGPSGSGKSTLLRLVSGAERPSAGRLEVFGHDLARLDRAGMARYRAETLGFLEQHYWRSLDPSLPLLDVVALQQRLDGRSAAPARRRARELLGRLGLGELAAAHAPHLSGGEQQRVAVCAALAHRPRLLLADEPTGELDADAARVVYDTLVDLAREQGTTVLIVSHDREAAAYVDRVVHIRDGRISRETARTGEAERLVVGRSGWLQLPQTLLSEAGIGDHVRATRSNEGIVLTPAGDPPAVAARESAWSSPEAARGGPIAASVRSLAVEYPGRRPVFDGYDAQFSVGELTALTGRSGSGKTTLIRLLAGLQLPDAGEVVVDGVELQGLSRTERAGLRRERIALVPQQARVTSFLNLRENVELALELRGLQRDGRVKRALAALAGVGLGEFAERPPDTLSAGQRKRLSLARAIAFAPLLLLADEPTVNLDEENAAAIARLLRSLARESGTAVVCATHDPIVVDEADAVVELDASPGDRSAAR
jgi:ABC-type lipoprotein export system ATPase subunit